MLKLSKGSSVSRGEPTISALLETALAMTFTISIAVYYNTLTHIFIGACIAPFLLLRSQESTVTGARWFSRGLKTAFHDYPLIQGFYYLLMIAWAMIVKICVTVRFLIPGIRSIPENWKIIVLCTDFASPIEMVPGTGPIKKVIDRVSDRGESVTLRDSFYLSLASCTVLVPLIYLGSIWHSTGILLLLAFMGFIPFMTAVLTGPVVISYAVVYAYRLSLKSTAILWFPLIYIAHTTYDNSMPLYDRLVEIKESAIGGITRYLSWFILVLLVIKLLLVPSLVEWWNTLPATSFFDVYLMPGIFHPWHIATGFNATLALVSYYFFFDQAPRRVASGSWSEYIVERILKIVVFSRGVISIYSISVGLYLTSKAIHLVGLPMISTDIFPW